MSRAQLTASGERGIQSIRLLAGTFMTSLDASGFSITLLKATPDMLEAIDDPTTAVGWPRSCANPAAINGKQVVDSKPEKSPRPPVDSNEPKSK